MNLQFHPWQRPILGLALAFMPICGAAAAPQFQNESGTTCILTPVWTGVPNPISTMTVRSLSGAGQVDTEVDFSAEPPGQIELAHGARAVFLPKAFTPDGEGHAEFRIWRKAEGPERAGEAAVSHWAVVRIAAVHGPAGPGTISAEALEAALWGYSRLDQPEEEPVWSMSASFEDGHWHQGLDLLPQGESNHWVLRPSRVPRPVQVDCCVIL